MYYGPRTVTNGLILCLDAANKTSYSGTGTVWKDLSGNGNNGTLTNGPTFNVGNLGSIVFDGSNDFVNMASLAISNANNVSAEIWFKMSAFGDKNLFYNGNSASSGFGFQFGAGGLTPSTLYVFFGGVATNVVSFPNASTNTWYQAVFTRTTTPSVLNTLYINGSSISTNTTNSPNAPVGGTTISQAAFSFNGNMAITRVYNRTLSASEVLQNYNATKSRFGL